MSSDVSCIGQVQEAVEGSIGEWHFGIQSGLAEVDPQGWRECHRVVAKCLARGVLRIQVARDGEALMFQQTQGRAQRVFLDLGFT